MIPTSISSSSGWQVGGAWGPGMWERLGKVGRTLGLLVERWAGLSWIRMGQCFAVTLMRERGISCYASTNKLPQLAGSLEGGWIS